MSIEYKGKKYSLKKKKGRYTLDLTAKGITNIDEIKGLKDLNTIQDLKLARNQISEIKGLENLTSLERLYLNDNKIKEIKGINHLKNLKLINLNNNLITKSENLDNMENLLVLSIYGNPLFDYVEENFGLILSPHKAVKYCGKLNIETIKDALKKLSLAYRKIKFDKISSQTGMEPKYLKKLVEKMIINKEINARIKGNSILFGKEDVKYITQGISDKFFIKEDQPLKIKCANCGEIINVTKEMVQKGSTICNTCGTEISIQKDFN